MEPKIKSRDISRYRASFGNATVTPSRKTLPHAVVTPLRKAASYEPRIAILGIWGDT